MKARDRGTRKTWSLGWADTDRVSSRAGLVMVLGIHEEHPRSCIDLAMG